VTLAVVNFLVLRQSKSPARWILPATFLVVAVLVIPIKPLVLPHPFQQPAELPTDTATDVFRQLHAGMYCALDFGSEDRIYDALDATIDGPLLEDLYLQLQESLRVREQGGAIARIKAITFTEATPIPRTESASTTPWPAFALRPPGKSPAPSNTGATSTNAKINSKPSFPSNPSTTTGKSPAWTSSANNKNPPEPHSAASENPKLHTHHPTPVANSQHFPYTPSHVPHP
jgi:hypothetical protein